MMEWYRFLCVFLPCTVYEVIMTRKCNGNSCSPLVSARLKKSLIQHSFWLIILCAYLCLVLGITGIGTLWDVGKYDSLIRMEEINLMPFSDIRTSHSFDVLNVMLFMPLGFLLPKIWSSMQNACRVTLLGFFTSLMLELCQLLNYRATDINDLIYNTLGTFAGYLVWQFLSRKEQGNGKTRRRTTTLSPWEPVMIVFLPILGVFLLYNPRAGIPTTKNPNDVKSTIRTLDTIPKADEASLDFEIEWISKHTDLFPDGKAEKAMDNPELCHFMFMLGNGDIPVDESQTLSDSEVSGKIPYLFQWDKRWGFESYGADNIGFSGCGPTCLAMILAHFNHDKAITPQILANYAMEQDYYEPGSGTRWSFMQEAAETFGVTVQTVYLSDIVSQLSAGHPIIASVGKGHFTDNGHFIVLAGIENGKIRIHDPNSVRNCNQLWEFNAFKNEIKSAWVYGIRDSQTAVTEHT